MVSNASNKENNNVNCFALTLKKDYSKFIAKHVLILALNTIWRVALSVCVLNVLTFFF